MKNLFSLLILTAVSAVATAQPVRLQVNHLTNPLGMDDDRPRMEWTVTGRQQAAYRLVVGTDSADVAGLKGNRWDTEWTVSDGSCRRIYAGKPLEPFTRYYWTVAVKDEEGKENRAEVNCFETGLMSADNWQGAWISDGQDRQRTAAPYFRKSFSLHGAVAQARAYIAVAGLFDLTVNGRRVADDLLTPVFTRYDRRCVYLTYDVTPQLQAGENVLGVVLGNGWYNHQARAVWDFDKAPWRNRPAFCMDLRVTYADGTVETIPTDLSWQTASGALTYNNIYTGEHYDFGQEKQGWNLPGYDAKEWHGVGYRSVPARIVSAQQMVPITKTDTLSATMVKRINDSTYVYDFGRNVAGITRFTLKGESGTQIRLIHGERLHADGTVDQSNIDVYYLGDKQKEPFQTDILTLDGRENTYEARFSYKGFRYVQAVANRPLELGPQHLTAYFIHSDVEETGSICSSNPLLNRVFEAARAAYLSNLMGYPTDCPQREKNGWTGDGHLAIETSLYSYDAITVYEKWLEDHRDEQQPNGVLPDIIPTCGWGYGTDNGLDWTSTIVLIPWNLYLFYGDIRPLQQCYDNMKRYVDYVDRNSPQHLSMWGRGDWVPVKTQSNKEFTSSVYFYTDALTLSKAAAVLGKEEDRQHYARLADAIKEAINTKYLDRQQGIYASGSQTEMSVALMWHIVPDELVPTVARNLADKVVAAGYHLDVGVLGAKALLNALSENGYAETAYRVAVQDAYPSWGWWIKNGATTLLENWDLEATRDISDNHIMFGEIGAWPYKGLGGIFPDEHQPGFRHIILRPNFVKGLTHFTARHRSPYGEIVSGWRRKGRKVVYEAVIPANSSATLYVPASAGVSGVRQLGPGRHELIF